MENCEEFTRLWTMAYPKVASFVAAALPDTHAAEDLLQEVAVACLTHFPKYDRQRSFLAWAMGVAKLEILSHRRQHARSRVVFSSDLLDNLISVYEELGPELDHRTHALRECVQSLPEKFAAIVRLRYEGDLRHREIARQIGITETHARVQLNRARAVLRACVERKLASYASP